MADSFARQVLAIAEQLIPTDDVLVQVRLPDDSAEGLLQKPAVDVRLTHVPTGVVVECASHPSQVQNKTEALLKLRLELDAAAEG